MPTCRAVGRSAEGNFDLTSKVSLLRSIRSFSNNCSMLGSSVRGWLAFVGFDAFLFLSPVADDPVCVDDTDDEPADPLVAPVAVAAVADDDDAAFFPVVNAVWPDDS